MTLTLNAVIKFYRKTPWLIMLYYQTKFGCKRTSSLEDIVEIVKFDYISPHCDLDIDDREPVFFLSDNLPPDNTPQYQVWFKMVERFRRYCSDKIGHMDRMTDGQMYRRTDVQTDRVILNIVRSTPKVLSYTEYL